MSLNETVSAERVHIAFFGMRNAGKSSLVNAVTGQSLSVVSDVKGTTTDPVKKAMELLPLGPVVIIDTPGLDDSGTLGDMRVKKAREVLGRCDIAVLVTDSGSELKKEEKELAELFKKRNIPYITAYNKCDLTDEKDRKKPGENEIYVSALTGENINALKEMLAALEKNAKSSKKIVGDLLSPRDLAVLVIPIDESAPKGRLILPQMQTMRDILDAGATFAACRDTELSNLLSSLSKKPRLVITDSQAFERVASVVPRDIPLTSFSILFARYKGELKTLVAGAAALSGLKDGDRVLISEGCTHHRQCNDIGTVKMPRMIEKFTGAKPVFSFTSGMEFPEELSEFSLIVHCGGCMLNEREMKSRIERAVECGVPIVNYGVAISHMHGILKRSLEIFDGMANAL